MPWPTLPWAEEQYPRANCTERIIESQINGAFHLLLSACIIDICFLYERGNLNGERLGHGLEFGVEKKFENELEKGLKRELEGEFVGEIECEKCQYLWYTDNNRLSSLCPLITNLAVSPIKAPTLTTQAAQPQPT